MPIAERKIKQQRNGKIMEGKMMERLETRDPRRETGGQRQAEMGWDLGHLPRVAGGGTIVGTPHQTAIVRSSMRRRW